MGVEAVAPDETVDTDFDFRSDRPAGKDPDSWSPTLRRYHRILWSKALPGGERFELSEAGKPGGYHLRHAATTDALLSRHVGGLACPIARG